MKSPQLQFEKILGCENHVRGVKKSLSRIASTIESHVSIHFSQEYNAGSFSHAHM
jgi:hypothetical protein